MAAIVMSLGAAALAAPPPGHAAVSVCPEPVNSRVSPEEYVRYDLDLCRWSTTSAYGDFAAVQTTIVEHTSCSAFADAFRAWTPTSGAEPPGMTGEARNGNWNPPVVVSLGRDPDQKGNYLVRITFKPVAGTATITLTRPTWPGITTSQQQRITTYLAVLLSHEKGHQDLAGHAIKNHEIVVSVTAKSATAAVTFVKTDPQHAPQALADAVRANKIVQREYEEIVVHGQNQSALGGTDLPSPYVCDPVLLERSRLTATASTDWVPCQPDPWTMLPSLIKQGDAFQETTYGSQPTYKAQDRTSSALGAAAGEQCRSQVSNVTADVPGTPALSGETRTVSKGLEVNSTVVTPAGATRALHSEASATVSGKYVNEPGRLTLSGTVAGSAAASDTVPPISPDQRLKPSCGAVVEYDLVVRAKATVSVRLQGQWSGSGNVNATLTAVGQGWVEVYNSAAEATLPGTWSTKSVLPGRYQFRLYQRCTRTGLSSTGGHTYAPLNLDYTVAVAS